MSSITSLIESAAEAIDARSWPGRLMLMLLRERFERTELAWDSINMSIWLSCVKCTSSPPRFAASAYIAAARWPVHPLNARFISFIACKKCARDHRHAWAVAHL